MPLLVLTLCLLGVSRLVTIVLPFRVVRRLLGEGHARPVSTAAIHEPFPGAVDRTTRSRAARIGLLISAASDRAPWRADCYPQALTARAMLRASRIPHTVIFGVRRDGGTLVAHAWVDAVGVPVTGGTGRDWTAVASFGWAPGERHAPAS